MDIVAKLEEYGNSHEVTRELLDFVAFCGEDKRTGHTVLWRDKEYALVFRQGGFQQFVVAWGYDDATGEWSQGRYYSDGSRAWDVMDPYILEDATVKWCRDDFSGALAEAGVEATDALVDEVIEAAALHRGWKGWAISHGNEIIAEAAADIAERHESGERDS